MQIKRQNISSPLELLGVSPTCHSLSRGNQLPDFCSNCFIAFLCGFITYLCISSYYSLVLHFFSCFWSFLNGNPLQYSCLENGAYSPWGRRVRHDWTTSLSFWFLRERPSVSGESVVSLDSEEAVTPFRWLFVGLLCLLSSSCTPFLLSHHILSSAHTPGS